MKHIKREDKKSLEASSKMVDEEETRAARLFAAGKITDEIWDNLWAEWNDRRQAIRGMLEILQYQQETHVDNLETALKIIAKVGV
jgi:hypothetical protein